MKYLYWGEVKKLGRFVVVSKQPWFLGIAGGFKGNSRSALENPPMGRGLYPHTLAPPCYLMPL